MKKNLALILSAALLTGALTACGSSHEQTDPTSVASASAAGSAAVPEGALGVIETDNPLTAAEWNTKTLLDPTTNTEHGQRAYISISKEDLKNVTEEQMMEFYNEKVVPSGAMWVSIICDDGTGIYFLNNQINGAKYGTADSMGRVSTAEGYLCLQNGSLTYSLEQPLESYATGSYQVGMDIPSGEYLILPDSTPAYYEVANDSSGDLTSIVANDTFSGSRYLTIEEGQYLRLNNCTAYPASYVSEGKVDNSDLSNGMYKVGIDITAGQFQIEPTEQSGSYAIEQDSKGILTSIVSNQKFKKAVTITLTEGQYLRLSNATLMVVDNATAQQTQTTTQTTQQSSQSEDTTQTGAASQPEISQDTLVYLSETGEKYHRETCPTLKDSKTPVTLEDAVSAGYEPCKICNP